MKQLLTLLLAGLLLAGCRPPDVLVCGPIPVAAPTNPPGTPTTNPPTTNPPTTTTPSSNIALSVFLAKNRPPLQRLRFVIGQSQPIRTAGGAALSVAGVRFLYDNNVVATDTAYLYLREIYRVPDMVLTEMPTVSQGGQLLISGGEFEMYIFARQGRVRATPAAGNPVLPVWQSPIPPGQDNTPQQFWQTRSSYFGWALNSSVAVQTVQSAQVQSPAYQVSMPLDSVYRFCNIDQIWSAYAGTTLVPINIAVPTSAYTLVMLQPISFNGVARANATGASGSSTTTWYSATMPLGTGLKAIVLQSINGQLYVGSETFLVQSGVLVTPTLRAVSEADALAFIRAL